nr:zinc finger, CCHC-type [Tanacetum cinerariifolium]
MLNEASTEKAAKRQKLDEEVEELKRHLLIVPNEDDDVYIEATPLARKVPVVDYEINEQNNKPYYKIIRADGTYQLYVSFMTLLRNFDREDLEALWSLVKERFSKTKPKNLSDDFLLVTLGAMFEKPDIHAQILKNQRIKRKYPLTKFILDQMLNVVRYEVKEGSEVSLELLRVPNKKNKITPYELYTKRKPNLNYLSVWGCRVVVRLPDPKLKTLADRGIECIFVGYVEHYKDFRPSLRISNGTKEIGGSVVPEEKKSINDEMDSIMGNNTWVLADLTSGCKPFGCKWIFKIKLKVDGTIEKFKERLVIQDGLKKMKMIKRVVRMAYLIRKHRIEMAKHED